jgi:predicted chitinase
MLQLTGKDSYARVTRDIRAAWAAQFAQVACPGNAPGLPHARAAAAAPDFAANPDAVLDPRWCLEVAAAMWSAKGCNVLADDDDIGQLTRRINGAGHGLAERDAWCRTAGRIWC